jgi:hypothetical protein
MKIVTYKNYPSRVSRANSTEMPSIINPSVEVREKVRPKNPITLAKTTLPPQPLPKRPRIPVNSDRVVLEQFEKHEKIAYSDDQKRSQPAK